MAGVSELGDGASIGRPNAGDHDNFESMCLNYSSYSFLTLPRLLARPGKGAL